MRWRDGLAGAALSTVLMSAAAQPAAPASAPSAAAPAAPSAAAVRTAANAVFHDPLLYRVKADREWRWRPDPSSQPPTSVAPWWRGFIDALAEGGRWLFWLAGAVLVAMLALRLRRWSGFHSDPAAPDAAQAPSHVRDLDIRPQSLPDDLPAAVRALWQQGQAQAALSLLYRGTLSRLVHDFEVPVRASSTEGECERLARRHVEADRSAFVTQVVALWQRAVYGARLPQTEAVHALCDDFNARLPRRRLGAA